MASRPRHNYIYTHTHTHVISIHSITMPVLIKFLTSAAEFLRTTTVLPQYSKRAYWLILTCVGDTLTRTGV